MTTATLRTGRTGRPGFGTRLFLAQSLVLIAGVMTSWLVATAVGPGLFHRHLVRAGADHSSIEILHIEDAFASALLISLSVASCAALAAALAVAWFFTRRVQRSVAAVASAARDVARGRYGSRIPGPGLGSEFDELAFTFNELADKLETTETTRRRMLADLAHEMRTPLATLDAHLEAIEDGVRQLDEPTLWVLRISTRRLGRLAHDISAVSGALEGNLAIRPVRTNPGQLVDNAADAARDRYRSKGVNLTLDGSRPPSLVMADPERLGQVLANVLDNALRHTSAGGTVTIGCHDVGRFVEIAITDTGDGIEAEHLGHVFDRFYRADTARTHDHEGSGIGLTISKALVEAHDGSIRVESRGAGLGARFTVCLPMTSAR